MPDEITFDMPVPDWHVAVPGKTTFAEEKVFQPRYFSIASGSG